MPDLPNEIPIYPGHPITLACQIAVAFPTLDAAHWRAPGAKYPAALGSDKVGGAGTYVRAALYALRCLRNGQPLDDVLARADGASEYTYRADWPAACEQARRFLACVDLVAWAQLKEENV